MESRVQGERLWRFLYRVIHPVLKCFLGLEAERLPAERPVMLICNHVTDLDFLLLAMASPEHPITFIASEHILRDRPLLRKIVFHLFAPITRRKATSAMDTCRKTVRAVREGRTVGIFAEGETTWNGVTGPIQPGTAVLVKAAGVPLVTYRFHGGYFTSPRWGKGLRRGKITGRVTGFWPAETLKAMSAEEVTALMEEGIREDAFEAQKRERIPYRVRVKNLLNRIDALLFLCPKCHGIGTLKAQGDRITCGCGLQVRLDRCLLPVGEAPFPDFSAWDAWQVSELQKMIRENREFRLAESRDDLCLIEIDPDGAVREAARGSLTMDRESLRIGPVGLAISEIRNMATLQNRKLAISTREHYYELHAPEAFCLRKYLLFWHQIGEAREAPARKET